MARKKKAPAHENHERWLVSYADFITLLFAFFVVLYATSATKPEKVEQFVGSVREAFNSYGIYLGVANARFMGPPDPSGNTRITVNVTDSPSGVGGVLKGGDTAVEPEGERDFASTTDVEPVDDTYEGRNPDESAPSGEAVSATPGVQPTATPEDEEEGEGQKGGNGLEGMQRIYNDMQTILAKELANSEIEMKMDRRGIIISLKEAGFFDSGSAEIKPGSYGILSQIAQKLQSMSPSLMLRVEGHTDDQPLRSNGRYRDNWDLSSARANSVIGYFVREHGYPPTRMVASGFGEWHPVASNDTAEGRARNRRVDVVILNEEYASLESSDQASVK